MALINDFLSLIYPRRCEACGDLLFEHEKYICNYCMLHLPRSNYHLDKENRLMSIFAGRVPLAGAASQYVFEKDGKVQKLIHAIKYEEQKELAQFLGGLYASGLEGDGWWTGIDVIIPIPLHKSKLKTRGFNQSEYYAKGFADVTGKELDTQSLKRTKNTETQTRKKKYERWENVESVFELAEEAQLENKHILLVDDVVTTGATIEAAWQALRKVENIQISVVSIAFASPRGD